MDISEVSSQAQAILAVMQQYQQPMDYQTVIASLYNGDHNWHNRPNATHLNSRAFDLLLWVECIQLQANGYQYELTNYGRTALNSPWPSAISSDRLNAWTENEMLVEALNQAKTSSEITVSRLVVKSWRQFRNVDLVFHPSLTIITGANGAGKTTLLNMLGPHFSWSGQLLTRRPTSVVDTSHEAAGQIYYSNGGRSPLLQYSGAPGISAAPLQIPQMEMVPGLFINSHRSISSYQQLKSLPARFSEWQTLQQDFASEIWNRYSGNSSQHSPLYRMKEALVAAAMYAYGNSAVRKNESALELWEGYQEVLRRFLPASLQFSKLEVEDAEIVIVTENAEFPLEAISGGISAMFELSWQIFLRQKDQEAFTVCIDEPENHLHPELQRSIIPSLLAAFPNVTFIVATHSPHVVTSTPDSNVYALHPDDDGSVSSSYITGINATATSDETLMSVLGLDSALPIWASSKIRQLMDEMPTSPTARQLREFRDELNRLGLGRQFPAAVEALGIQR